MTRYKKGSVGSGALVVVVLVIIGGGLILFASKPNEASAPIKKDKNAKSEVKCTLYSEGLYQKEYKANDKSLLPEEIASVANGLSDSALCGSIPSLGYVYYLSSADDQVIFNAYKERLRKIGCKADEVEKGEVNSSFSSRMAYACDGGSGLIAADAKYQSFYVSYKKAEAIQESSNASSEDSAGNNGEAEDASKKLESSGN